MKYPLDNKAMEDIAKDILMHSKSQKQTIDTLMGYLEQAIRDCDPDYCEWHDDVQTLIRNHQARTIEFENHRFDQSNGYNTHSNSPFPAEKHERIENIDITKEAELNKHESENFGGEMSEEDIAKLFNERAVKIKKKKKKVKKLNKMTLNEIEEWERAQDNSNDIYKVAARIKNAARFAVKGNLTAQGEMVTNTFAHLIKAFYDFAENIEDKELKIRLVELTKKQEDAPANLIAALSAGVKIKN